MIVPAVSTARAMVAAAVTSPITGSTPSGMPPPFRSTPDPAPSQYVARSLGRYRMQRL